MWTQNLKTSSVFYFFGWVTSSLYSWQSYSPYTASEVYNLSIYSVHTASRCIILLDFEGLFDAERKKIEDDDHDLVNITYYYTTKLLPKLMDLLLC